MRRYQAILVVIDLVAAGMQSGWRPWPDSACRTVARTCRYTWPWTCRSAGVGHCRGVNRAYEGRSSASAPPSSIGLFKAFLYLTAVVAIGSYATHTEIARGFVVVALPVALGLDLAAGTAHASTCTGCVSVVTR